MQGYTIRRFDELESIFGGAVRLAGDGLGVEAFGLQLLDLPPGFAEHPEHDHAHDRQEEVYVVLAGSATFEVAGATERAEAGTLLRVDADARRRLVAGPDGVRVLAIGCVPGAYERPDAFRAAVSA
jgi:uncharacterized cupin superfamily protein